MSYLRRSQQSPLQQAGTPSRYLPTTQANINTSSFSPYTQITSPVKQAMEESQPQQQQYQNQNQNYRQQAPVQEQELWKSRCNDLESSLQQTNTELLLANNKLRQSQNLEDKVDIVMRNNQQLIDTNEKLSKQLTQKLTECDIWKQKYERELNDKISLKSQSELQTKRLNEDINFLRDKLDQVQVETVQIQSANKSDAETSAHQKLNILKDNHCQEIGLYEEQTRKLREILEDREKQISILNQKLQSQKNDSHLEMVKFNEEKQKILTQLSQQQVENQKKKELDTSKSEIVQSNNIENLKNHYQNEIDVLTSENSKLKELLELKNGEISSLINQNKNQKSNNDEESNGLREEIEELKNKIHEINTQKLDELEELKQSLHQSHTTDLQGLRFHHENQIEALEKEVEHLHELIEQKSQQIDEQIKEKLEQRQNYNSEIDRQNEVVLDLKQQIHQLEDDLSKQKDDNNTDLEAAHANYMNEIKNHSDHNAELENQIKELQSLLEHRTQDLEATREQGLQIQEGLQKEVEQWKDQAQDWESKYCKACHDSELVIEDLKLRLNVQENDANEEKKKNQIIVNSQEQEIKRLQDINEVKSAETKNLQQSINQLEQEIVKLRGDIEQLQDNLNFVERNKNSELQEQRQKMEQSHNYTTQTMKQSFDNQVNIMEQEIQELNVRLQLKEKEFQNYVTKYNKMEAVIQDFVNNPDKLTNKADVITTKNLYDVLRSSNRSPVKRTYSPIKRSQYY